MSTHGARQAREDTFLLRGRDGSYRWFLSRALPIRNEAGDVIRWFGTTTDTEHRAVPALSGSFRERWGIRGGGFAG